MIIHQGVAGTTSQGCVQAFQMLLYCFTADQPFWGRRVKKIGVGPQPIYVNQLSVEKLTQSIVEADDNAIRKRAQAIGQRIRSEDGVKYTAELIESSLPKQRNFKVQLPNNY